MIRFALMFGIVMTATSLIAEEGSAKLVESIQGKWQRKVERDGTIIRVVKSIEAQQETLTQYIGEEAVYAHRIDFKVTVTAGGSVFSYDNMRITAGPDAGRKSGEKGAYIFKIDEDAWYEVHRMMPGDSGSPWITTYERMK